MRVLISGGGIAGLTLAYWLQQYAIPAVVIERATNLRRDGYAIDFYGTGYDVAQRMGLIDRLASEQIPLDAIAYVNRKGKPIATLEMTLMQQVMDGKYLGLMHWTLEEALYDALGGQVEVRFGCSLASIHPGTDAVDVTFTDGMNETFDLLIGADGVHSLTRELVFGPETRFSHFLGYMIASYLLADHYGIGQSWQMYTTPGRMVSAYASRQGGEIITFFLYHQAEPDRLAPEQRLPRLRQVFAEMGWITPQLLADVAPSAPIFMDAVSQIRMPIWHQGRVALVGDACGCPTLLSGQGASLAMGGAYLLAEALHETTEYQEAFRRYDQKMRPHVQTQQQHAPGLAKSFAPTSRIGILAQRVLLKAVLREACTGLLRRQFGAESFLPARQMRR